MSRVELAVLAALNVVLAAALVMCSGEAAQEQPRVWPIAPQDIERIDVELASTDTSYSLVRSQGRLDFADHSVRADPVGVDDLAATITSLRPADTRAEAPAAVGDAPLVTVTVHAAGTPMPLVVYPFQPRAAVAVAARPGGQPFYIATDVVAVLSRSRGDMRSTAVALGIGDAVTGAVVDGDVQLRASGTPLVIETPVGPMRASQGAVADTVALARRLRYSILDPSVGGAPAAVASRSLSLSGDGFAVRIADAAPCPGRPGMRLLVGNTGTGCVPAVDVERLFSSATPPRWLDRDLAAVAGLHTLEIAHEGNEYVVSSRDTGADAVDPAAMSDFVRTMRGHGEPTAIPTEAIASGRLVAIGDAGARAEIDLYRIGSRVLARRRGDAAGFVLTRPQRRVLAAGPIYFRIRELVRRDPLDVVAVRAVRRGRVVVDARRGELVGEWTDAGGVELEPDEAALADSLAGVIGQLAATEFVSAAPLPRHGLSAPAVEITYELGPGSAGEPATKQTLSLSAPDAAGCYARIGDLAAVFRLEKEVCSFGR